MTTTSLTQKVNTYFAFFLIMMIGSIAAFTIIKLANTTSFNVVYMEADSLYETGGQRQLP